MNLNWKAIGISFVVAIVIGILGGLYLPKNISLIGPLIGGLISGYIVSGRYTDGILNGGIPAGIAGLIATAVLALLSVDQVIAAMANMGYAVSRETLTAALVIGGAIVGFILFFIVGLIGGIIGVAVKNRNSS